MRLHTTHYQSQALIIVQIRALRHRDFAAVLQIVLRLPYATNVSLSPKSLAQGHGIGAW
jgi:hypothetical protein